MNDYPAQTLYGRRFEIQAFALVNHVRECEPVVRRVVEQDEHRRYVEDSADAFADGLGYRVEVELFRERFSDVVDDRKLGVPLLGLREKTVRLIEQPRVLERHAQAAGERRQQADIGLGERVCSIEVLKRD